MKRHWLVPSLLLAALAGCTDLDVTNPNQQTTDTFWRNQNDAVQAVNATYNGLQLRGTYGRWLAFAHDIRADIGQSRSGWGELSQFHKFTLGSYDFEVNTEIYGHHYQAIFRANQVIANTPNIAMDEAMKARLIGEAKFIRGLLYYNLAVLYGSVPLVLVPSNAEDRTPSATNAQVWAQVEKDFSEARAALPASYGGQDLGRATSGAATAMLGKAYLQQKKWADAATALGQVASSGRYQLVADYGNNFRVDGDNNAESVFEVQFGGPAQLSSGTVGVTFPRMAGPCDVGFCDVQPTAWFVSQFDTERTVGGQVDPRKDATVFYNKPGGMDVFGRPFAQRYPNGRYNLPIDSTFFWKKYTEHYLTEQDWDNAINIKVARLGGVLLLHAEALNESNRPADALPFLNQVRARAGLAPVPGGLSQAAMRARIEHEQVKELGFEMERFAYLQRHDMLNSAEVRAHDPDEFRFFVPSKSELLPIPTTEIAQNPNVKQNPGY